MFGLSPFARAAYAADGQTITFPNGGTATLHADGSITGTCDLTDCSVEHRSDGRYYYTGSKCHMPDGAVFWVECYEKYISDPNHEKYAGPWNGSGIAFTAMPNGDGSYFVLVHSQDLPRCWPHLGLGNLDEAPSWPSQRVYNANWRPVITGHMGLRKRAKRGKWL